MAENDNKKLRPSVLIVGHGSSISKEAEETAKMHARFLSKSGCYEEVGTFFLTGNETAPELPTGDVFLLPFFMSNGFFVQTKISEIFELHDFEKYEANRNIFQCNVLGLEPMLSRIFAKMVHELCQSRSLDAKLVDVVLLSHGSSKSSASREASSFHENLLQEMNEFGSVSSAYLEEKPSLATLVNQKKRNSNSVIVLGMFSAEGPHAMIDVPEAIAHQQGAEKTISDIGKTEIIYAGIVGVRPEIADVMQNCIERHRARYQS